MAGSLTAGFLSPALVQWVGLDSPSYASGAAFILGLLGMSLAAALIAGIRETPVGAILASWLTRKG